MHQILLIRHGEAAKSSTDADPGLTERGQQQAEALADRLVREFQDGVGVRLISSPKARAIQTAVPIATRWKTQIVEDPSVIEIPSPQGMPLKERSRWIRNLLNSQWDSLTPTQVQWRKGITDRLRQLYSSAEREPFHTTLVFCHFMVINSVVAAIRHDLQVAQFHPDYASQTRLALNEGKLIVKELGQEKSSDNLIQ
ncbi:histidine phosphatase family protein [Microbulbifer pacificus]|uniref:histidine phosphatase family protein n=1 Tax=Microbulbifer pacificus TaxID=407164 RepID=UPI001319DC6E|nr:histidine phosphatase family protein [Microbulbifer pacificus]